MRGSWAQRGLIALVITLQVTAVRVAIGRRVCFLRVRFIMASLDFHPNDIIERALMQVGMHLDKAGSSSALVKSQLRRCGSLGVLVTIFKVFLGLEGSQHPPVDLAPVIGHTRGPPEVPLPKGK